MRADRGLRDGDDRVLLRQNDGELAHRAVRPVGAARLAHPDLEAVAEEVVGGLGVVARLGGGVVLVRRGEADIVLGEDALALPNAAVGIELHQTEVVLRRGEEPAAADLDAVGHAEPAQVVRVDADLVEKTRRQIIVEAQPRLLPDDGAQKRGAGGIVHVGRARLVVHRDVQEVTDPVLAVAGHLVHAAAHAQHVAHGEELQVLAGLGRRVLGEDVDDALVQTQQALGVGDADRGGRVSLGVALQPVAQLRGEGRPPALRAELAVPHDHESVHLGLAALQRVDIVENVAAADADGLGRGGLKRFSCRHVLLTPLRRRRPCP